MEKKIKRIEEYFEQTKFDLRMNRENQKITEDEITWKRGIITGLKIALKILKED